MRKLQLIFFAIMLFGCDKGTPQDPGKGPDDNPPVASWEELGEKISDNIVAINGKDGVSVWTPENEITFTDHYSIIETIIEERVISRDVKYYCGENENVSVKWYVNNTLQSNVSEKKVWVGDMQKWIVISTAQLDVKGISKDINIEVIIQYSEKKVRRAKTISLVKVEKKESDIFGFTFGAKRQDMGDYIVRDYPPALSAVSELYSNKVTYCGFSDGNLVALYAAYSYSNLIDIDHICEICKIPEPLRYNSMILENPQDWIHGKLKFKVYNTTYMDFISPQYNMGDIILLFIEKV